MRLNNSRRRFVALGVLRLEDRTVPSTLIWRGDVNGLWGANVSKNTNWFNFTTSIDNVLPQNGDILQFPAGAGNRSNTNDMSGLSLSSITVQGTDYVVGGNAVALTGLSDTSTSGAN